MAELSLSISDGSTTISLTSGADGISLLKYTPLAPETSHLDLVAEMIADGGERVLTTRRNITETARVLIEGADVATLESNRQAVEKLLRQAEEYQNNRALDLVYISITPADSSNTWTSDILSGQIAWDEQVLEAGQWGSLKAIGVITWTRRWYWEGASAELRLTNKWGTDTIGGLQVDNSTDAAATAFNNYVTIPAQYGGADQIKGTIPTPARLLIRNTLAANYHLNTIQCAHNVFSDPANFDHFLEVEDGTDVGGGAAAANGDPSASYTWSGSAARKWIGLITTAEVDLVYWELDATFLSRAKGRNFLVTVRQAQDAGRTAVMRARLRIEVGYDAWYTAWTGGWQNINDGDDLQSLGVVRIPPYLTNYTDLAGIRLYLSAKYAPGSGDYYLDYIQLSPMDSIRGYFSNLASAGVYTDYSLADDGYLDDLYVIHETSTRRAATYRAIGAPIMLWPGRVQRLYFLWNDKDKYADPTENMVLQVWHKPRVLTI